MASVIISIRVNFSDIVKHTSTFDTLATSIHPKMNSIWYKVLDSVKQCLYKETYFDENNNIIDKVVTEFKN